MEHVAPPFSQVRFVVVSDLLIAITNALQIFVNAFRHASDRHSRRVSSRGEPSALCDISLR
jgi:hypothetical protein